MKERKEQEVYYKVLCENGGEPYCVYKAETQEAVTRWLDIVLEKATRGRFGLMSELNDIQTECQVAYNKGCFPNKFTMPLKIVNLTLQPYGFWIKDA